MFLVLAVALFILIQISKMCLLKIVFINLLLASLIQALSYAFDTSCYTRYDITRVKKAVAEAVNMANVAATRILDSNDQVTARLFYTIWKRTPAQTLVPLC
jgi:hypothetical protein